MTDAEYTTTFKSFEKLYSKTPGIMAIVEDDTLHDTILVYIDRDTFKATSILPKYQGLYVDVIDAYEQYAALSAAYEKIKEHYHGDETATPVTHFKGMIDFLKVVVDIYELTLTEQQGDRQ